MGRNSERGSCVSANPGTPTCTAQNHRRAPHIRDLEHRLSQLLGRQAFERSGLDAASNTAALQAQIDRQHQIVLDLTQALEERDEELAAARETNRRLMTELNRISAVRYEPEGAH
ncbi:hypothetical protein BU204_37660 [Actinophytocola xanthii]|uniref:Uncharacterized protein n=2 Tax=Actinophytocola xanthii TaxID=1912961 RepID=A0A1Q8BR39_9PSEU|nr:hypothetical protein BU204_37660 [Actinophytocola xanthii]